MLRKLKQFIFSLIILVTILQLYSFLVADNEIDRLTRILMFLVIIGAFSFRFINRRESFQVPFMDFFIHATTFLIVNLSFWVHAFIILLVNPEFSFSMGWLGILVVMPALWGIGLLIEAITVFNSKACKTIKS